MEITFKADEVRHLLDISGDKRPIRLTPAQQAGYIIAFKLAMQRFAQGLNTPPPTIPLPVNPVERQQMIQGMGLFQLEVTLLKRRVDRGGRAAYLQGNRKRIQIPKLIK